MDECVYCDSLATTDDHVPAKGFFAKDVKTRGWKSVRSCDYCNCGSGSDDNYARNMIALRANNIFFEADDVLTRAEGGVLGGSVVDALRRLNFRVVPLRFGFCGMYDIDLLRIERVITRYMRGLFYDTYRRKLPAYRISPPRMLPRESLWVRNVPGAGGSIEGNFTYRFIGEPSCCLLTFYQNTDFLAVLQ